MDTKVVLLCIVLIFVLSTNGSFRNCFKGSKGSKGQKGGSALMVGGVLFALALGAAIFLGAGGYHLLFGDDSKTCSKYKKCPAGKQKKANVGKKKCKDNNDCAKKCCETHQGTNNAHSTPNPWCDFKSRPAGAKDDDWMKLAYSKIIYGADKGYYVKSGLDYMKHFINGANALTADTAKRLCYGSCRAAMDPHQSGFRKASQEVMESNVGRYCECPSNYNDKYDKFKVKSFPAKLIIDFCPNFYSIYIYTYMDNKVVLLCIALIFVLSTNGSFKGYFKGSKGQKGGADLKKVGGVVAVLAFIVLLGVGGYMLFWGDSKTCADYEQCSDGTQKKVDVDTTECEDDSDCQTKCCEPSDDNLGDGEPTPSAYIKYDSTSRTWGEGKPCVPFSSWAGDAIPGTNANTDTSVMTSDGAVICQVPSADENGVCTGDDCIDECNTYYGNSSSSDSKLHICGVSGRSDNKCVTTGNDLFRVYTDSDCSGP